MSEATQPYERGKWRNLPSDTQRDTVFFLSHILVRHAASDVGGDEIGFRALGWTPDGEAPSRNRVDALLLAAQIFGKLKSKSSTFEDLARRYSEDRATRDLGGALGGIRATQLASSLLDGIDATPEGATTRVIETAYGFHILKRLPPPARETLAGQRIVIPYQGCIVSPGMAATWRSREAASTLAHTIRNRSAAKDFASLVFEYSEHADKVRIGALGSWQSDEPSDNGSELLALSQLPVGGVSQPIDSALGFQIIRRTAPQKDTLLAAEIIEVRYDRHSIGDHGREAARRTIDSFLSVLREDPAQFSRIAASHCCEGVSQWQVGHFDDPHVEAAVLGLELGGMTLNAIDTGWQYILARRVEPNPQHKERDLHYGFPDTAVADLDAIVDNTAGEALSRAMAKLAPTILRSVNLSSSKQDALRSVFSELESEFSSAKTLEARRVARSRAQRSLANVLSVDEMREIQELIQGWASSQMMKNAI